MDQPRFEWWRSKDYAAQLGCTNHARLFGLVPGFWSDTDHMWVSRSDALNWLEDLLGAINGAIWSMRGEDAQFAIAVGRPIALAS